MFQLVEEFLGKINPVIKNETLLYRLIRRMSTYFLYKLPTFGICIKGLLPSLNSQESKKPSVLRKH